MLATLDFSISMSVDLYDNPGNKLAISEFRIISPWIGVTWKCGERLGYVCNTHSLKEGM